MGYAIIERRNSTLFLKRRRRKGKDTVKIGIHNWFGYRIEHKERLRLIKEAGFDSVLLWWGDEPEGDEKDKQSLPDAARALGLEVENIHAPFDNANLLWTDDLQAEEIMNRYKQCILYCSVHQIPTTVLHLTGGDTPPPPSELGLQRIKALTELAEQKNVNIAMENVRRFEHIQFVFDRIQSDRLGFCYDSGHENCFTKGANLLDLFGDRLFALHLHDNDETGDLHLLPGDGTVHWESVMKKIKACHYPGPLTLEVNTEFTDLYEGLSASRFLNIAYERIKSMIV